MPSSVDNRVVRIEFDNKDFERKVNQTILSIDKLNKSLKMEGAQKGLDNLTKQTPKIVKLDSSLRMPGANKGIEDLTKKTPDVQKLDKALALPGAKKGIVELTKEAKKFDVSGLGTIKTTVESVNKGFLTLATVGVAAIGSITVAAVAAGTQIAQALTITPALQGFKEYELNIGSIQTILANTKQQGSTLDDVNKALQNLNTYSDKTIYNFAQMARNIGTFTAAGVDLETSTQSIKGIANLAAISGSTSEQASTAMYQLSQAIAAGSLKLMDWNSVVNAGMGGEVFKQALFETGKALGEITDVPVNQTFKEWTDAGNSFRESLQDGWITSEVLTTTLQGFTGEMTEAQLVAKGFSKEAAKNLMELGALGVDSATKVRTLTGLLATTKEQLATGFADTFRLIVGDFDEATKMFTAISKTIGGIVSRSADARNKLLEGWKAFGGRTVLLEGFKDLWNNILIIIKPIQKAFRDIFPKTTVKQLLLLTKGFADFAKSLKPNDETLRNLRRAFRGLFAILSIGWNIIKEGTKFILGLGKALTKAAGPGVLEFLGDIGDFFTNLQKGFVKGKGIQKFFTNLGKNLSAPVSILERLKRIFADLFSGFGDGVDAGGAVSSATGRITDRFESLRKVIEPVFNFLKKVGSLIATVGKYILDFYKEIGIRIAEVMKKGDFNALIDTLNVAVLGGLALFMKKLLKTGLNFKFAFENIFTFGDKNLGKNISSAFGELTNTLKALQAEIKSKALLNIAFSVGILTASVIALSLIDSAALTKALTAMAVGFGQLVAVFALLNKIEMDPRDAVKIGVIAGSMILMSGAILLLASAAKKLSKLNWDELGRGLTGTVALLGSVVGATHLMKTELPHLMATAAGMVIIATALNLMASAVKKMAQLKWDELGRGLAGVAGGLGALIGATHLMDEKKMFSASLGMIALSIALIILSKAVAKFNEFDWGELGKGAAAIGGGLVIIAAGMTGMPANLPLTAAGLILVGIALGKVADAMQDFAGMKWGEIGKGLAAMGLALVTLAIGVTAMGAAFAGALALAIIAPSLLLLVKVIDIMSDIGWGELGKGIGVMAAALAALGVSALALAPAVPAMVGLGIALGVLGAAFVLFGAGAFVAAKAFEVFAKVSASGAENAMKAIKTLAKAIPAFATEAAKGTIEFIDTILSAAPGLLDKLGEVIVKFLGKIRELIPEYQKTFIELITAGLEIIREKTPDIVATGFFVLIEFLRGIRDNISEIVVAVSEIVQEFLRAFNEEIPTIVEALIETFRTIFTSLAEGAGELMATIGPQIAKAFLDGFLKGLEEQFPGVMKWFRELPGKILGLIKSLFGIKSPSTEFMKIGVDIMLGLLNGLTSMLGAVMEFFTSLPGKIFGWIGATIGWLVDKGKNIIKGLLKGITDKFDDVKRFFENLPTVIKDVVVGAFDFFGGVLGVLKDVGKQIIEGFVDGLDAAWNGVGGVVEWVGDKTGDFVNMFRKPWFVKSPSLLFKDIGNDVMLGLQIGLEDGFKPIEKSMSKMVTQLTNIEDFNPTITPVLDLTTVQSQAATIGDYISKNPALVPTLSTSQAIVISSDLNKQATETTGSESTVTQPSFTQIINAPEQLSTADIYKQTRNQIAMAKEELKIP